MSVQPVSPPQLPRVISTVRALTGSQVALVMICGNCSFGLPLFGAIVWAAERFNWNQNVVGWFGIPLVWAVGFAAIFTHAHFTIRWTGRADRRARTTIIIGTAVLVGLTAATIPIGFDEDEISFILVAPMPSLIVQAIVLWCVFGREGRRWFASGSVLASSSNAGD